FDRPGLRDTPAEDGAADAGATTPARDLPGRLPLTCRAVDRALAGDDEVEPRRVEPDLGEHELCSGDELRAQRRQGGAESAGRAGSRERRVGGELRQRKQAPLELGDVGVRRALLRREDSGRVDERRADDARGAGRSGELANDLSKAGPSVDRRRPTEADDELARAAE